MHLVQHEYTKFLAEERSILRPDQPGVARPGYEGYAQLLRAATRAPIAL